MTSRTREILASDHDWWDVFCQCDRSEHEHRLESARLFPQFSTFEDGLTETERAWFK